MVWLRLPFTFAAFIVAQCVTRSSAQSPLDVDIGVLLALNDTSTDVVLAGVQVAIYDYNQRENRELTLNPIYRNTESSGGVVFTQILSLQNLTIQDLQPEFVDLIIGPRFSGVATNAASVAGEFTLPLISASATSDILSDIVLYPTFSRTVPNDGFQGDALARLVKSFGVRAVNTVSVADSQYSSRLATVFVSKARQLDILVEQHSFSLTTDPEDFQVTVDNILETGITVIVILTATHEAQFALQAFWDNGMINEQYTYFGGDGWVDQNLDPQLIDRSVGTTVYVPEGTGRYQQFAAQWRELNEVMPELTLGFEQPLPFSTYYYDAVLLAASSLEEWYDDVTRQKGTRTELLELIRSIEIDGVTGTFSLDATGERLTDYAVVNHRDGGARAVGTVSAVDTGENGGVTIFSEILWPRGIDILPESLQPTECVSNGFFTFSLSECDTTSRWTVIYELDPNDGQSCLDEAPSPEFVGCDHLPFDSQWSIALAVLAVIFIVTTTVCGVIVVLFRKVHPFVQAQPLLLVTTVIGAVMGQAFSFAVLGPMTNGVCVAQVATYAVGWNVFFSGLFLKTYRSYELLESKVLWMSFWRKAKLLGALYIAQAVVFAAWMGIDPPGLVAASKRTESGLAIIEIATCNSGETGYALFLILINVLWFLYSVYLAFHIRNVEFNHKEAYHTTLAHIIILLCGLVTIPFWFFDSQVASEKIPRQLLIVLFGTGGSVLLLVVPKLLLYFQLKNKKNDGETFDSLESILDNEISSFYLKRYLMTQYAAETIDFLEDASRFQVLAENKEASDEAVRKCARDLFDKRVKLDVGDGDQLGLLSASKTAQVNVSHQTRQEIARRLDEDEMSGRRTSVGIYDEAVFEAKKLIFTNYFFPFLRSQEAYAAQRTLVWAMQYRKMRGHLKKSVVRQLFRELDSSAYKRPLLRRRQQEADRENSASSRLVQLRTAIGFVSPPSMRRTIKGGVRSASANLRRDHDRDRRDECVRKRTTTDVFGNKEKVTVVVDAVEMPEEREHEDGEVNSDAASATSAATADKSVKGTEEVSRSRSGSESNSQSLSGLSAVQLNMVTVALPRHRIATTSKF